MKKRTKRKIIIVLVSVFTLVLISSSLFVYVVLGPFRSLFWTSPYLMGFLGTKNYLLLIENNNELRPTGGFITAVGHISTLFGYPQITVSDSYQIPDPSPKIAAPEPFNFLIGSHDPFFAGWTLRDANFSPDFAKSCQDIIQLYQKAYPDEKIDGVFSIDFAVIERLLKEYGPITAEDTTFDDQNFFANTQRLSKNIDTHDVEQLKGRKNVLKPFANALIKAIIDSPARYRKLFQILYTLGEEKHFLAYSGADSIEQKFSELGLSGNIHPAATGSDYLHVNIANIGGRKADRYMTKDIQLLTDYSNPEKEQSKLDITLEHLGSYNIQSDIYQAYIRVYVPDGSELMSSTGEKLRNTETYRDLGLTVFADTIRMKPGDKITLSYIYSIPEAISASDYHLRLIKQPGFQNDSWRVALKQMNDSSMENAADEDVTALMIHENLAIWSGELDHDLDFHARLTADKQGPVILWQQFTRLNQVNVRFNELLDTKAIQEITNYQIIDVNEKNTVSDTVRVTAARFEDRDLWLTVEGVTNQPDEHYQLSLKDIRDVNGNTTDPNPMIRTLVQRLTNP